MVFTSSVSATIISSDNTNLDYGSGIADLQGLGWLSLDETLNIPRSDIESGYNDLVNNGWRYATRNETEKLVTSLWGGAVDYWSSTNYNGADWFLTKFGYTSSLVGVNPTNYFQSRFIFGYTGECSTRSDFICYGAIEIFDNNTDIFGYLNDGNWTYTETYFSNTGQAGYFADSLGLDAGRTSLNSTVTEPHYNGSPYASLLVRDIAAVPEPPPAILLILSGLLGLFAVSRREKLRLI